MKGLQNVALPVRQASVSGASIPRDAPSKGSRRKRQDRGRLESAASLTLAISASSEVRVRFSLPRRVDFGHHLCIVGKGDSLGAWDVGRSVQMNWTDGDVWVAELEVPADDGLALEYKYVVQNDFGQAVEWKPGANCELQLALPRGIPPGATTVSVNDDWEHCTARVELDFPMPNLLPPGKAPPHQTSENWEPSPSQQHLPAAAPNTNRTAFVDTTATATAPSAAIPEAAAAATSSATAQPEQQQRRRSRRGGRGSSNGNGAARPGVVMRQAGGLLVSGMDDDEDDEELEIVAAAAERAMRRLDAAICSSQDLLDHLEDPSCSEAFEADRRVAAAARKAMALTKALTAADPRYRLSAMRANNNNPDNANAGDGI